MNPSSPNASSTAGVPPPPPPPPPGGSVPEVSVYGPNIEDSVVGTWFARIGVLAVLIGAAFGYRYAVDQGWIDPAARVMLGALVGLGFLVGGHWARSKRWEAFSSAMSGGGIAILYLSVLAALLRYELLSPATALVMLTGVALVSAWLSLMYDSLPLAVLATLGAFMNPFFISSGDPDPSRALTYVVAIDLGIVALAYAKRWPSLTKLALVGSTAVVAVVAGDAGMIEGLGFTAILWALFTVVPFVQVLRDRAPAQITDAAQLVVTSLLFLGAGMFFLQAEDPLYRGLFTLVLSIACGGFTFLALSDPRSRTLLPEVMGGLAISFFTLAAPIALDGPTVWLIWSVEGSLLLWLGGITNDARLKWFAGGLIVAGIVGALELMATYSPDELLISGSSVVLAAQIASIFVVAWLLPRGSEVDDWEHVAAPVLALIANLLTLGWLSREVMFEVQRRVDPADVYLTMQFAFSALWGLYAALLFVIGVVRQMPWARYLAIGLFALTIAKMVSVDIWELGVLYRMVAFVGLGALLLTCSLMYNRMRDLVIGKDA